MSGVRLAESAARSADRRVGRDTRKPQHDAALRQPVWHHLGVRVETRMGALIKVRRLAVCPHVRERELREWYGDNPKSTCARCMFEALAESPERKPT